MMSPFSIDELLSTAGNDGGSIPVASTSKRLEFDELFKAWTIERGHSIECEILLNLSRALLVRLQANQPTQAWHDRQDAEDLIEQIEHRLHSCPLDRS